MAVTFLIAIQGGRLKSSLGTDRFGTITYEFGSAGRQEM